MNADWFSIERVVAMMRKEFIQMRRDRLTFVMMLGIPVFQMILFGYAINTDPKDLPTAVIVRDDGPLVREYFEDLARSGYFRFIDASAFATESRFLFRSGKAKLTITIPPDFSRKLARGESPQVLIEADATNPMTIDKALATAERIGQNEFRRSLRGPLANANANRPPIETVVHRVYNPEEITQYNTVPGLLGVILTLTMVFITALAITREMERGTMENLLSLPVRPLEVLIGKIVPYVFVGLAQVGVIMLGAKFLFRIPMVGGVGLLLLVTLTFIAVNLAVGVTFSAIARNQLQAIQMSIFFFLPSILLSGFMFPLEGMPIWARWIGWVLPLTHFNPIVRGVMLKNSGFTDFAPNYFYLLGFLLVVLTFGALRYRRTLD